MTTIYSLEECEKHDQDGDYWVVIAGYVLDISNFLDRHPSGAQKIHQKRQKLGVDISPNFLDHFPHTVKAFREACSKFDQAQEPVAFLFKEVEIEVVILGKVGG